MRHRVGLLGWAVMLVSVAQVPGQQLAIATIDGGVVTGRVLELVGEGREANLQLEVDGQRRNVPLAAVLAMRGPAPAPVARSVIHLVGGDQLRGELKGGGADGETFTVRSSSLGELPIQIDRLRVVLLGDDSGADPASFELPAGAQSDEALFRRARQGYDTILGAIHRFTPRGVLFEWAEDSQPELFTYDDLAAVALRGGVERERPATAQLVTRAGDVIGVDLVDVREGRLLVRVEGGREVNLPPADLSALTFFGPDRRYLSDMQPIEVEERGGGFGDATPLYPFRKDRAAAGGFLVVGGLTHGKGLGAHSESTLRYRVPEGFGRFHALVGIDDGVLATSVRGSAIVSVSVDDQVVFGPQVVRGGESPRSVGPLPVGEGQLLTLRVEFGEGWFVGDRVDWVSPVLLR